MLKGRIYCDRNYETGEIDPRLFGSFVEHMGRVVYSGIYEPEHDRADEQGFREDVLDAVQKMGVTAVRYPGGNFVSGYHWEDGVGPKENRPRKLDLAWKAIETNEFGTDEFMQWAKKANVKPILTVNLGTRGMEDALAYLEYCNFPKGTQYSDLRRKNGREQPYGISLWCLGNEMDGAWQIGHKSAGEYGRLAAETAKNMKLIDPQIETIVCGSSLSSMESYPRWDEEVLEQTYDYVDYMALHQYYGGQEKGSKEFLAQTLDMEEYIRTIRAVAQVVKQKKHSAKELKFSIDEWGVWALPGNSVNKEIDQKPWEIAPAISEQIYTLEDAILFAGMQMVMLRNADAVKIACQSLLVNVSACIMTEKGKEMWLQTIYYPFYFFANYAKGTVMDIKVTADTYACESYGNVPYLDAVVVFNRDQRELALFFINKSETEKLETEVELNGYSCTGVLQAVVLTAADKKMTNQHQHDAVVPKEDQSVVLDRNRCKIMLESMSFEMVRIAVK